MTSERDCDTWSVDWTYRDDPIFSMDWSDITTYPNGDKLPAVWITQPIAGSDGRTYMMKYPCPDLSSPFPSGDDENGDDALYYGAGYYKEGMSYTNPADHDKRVDCFRAAEMLYRHAAGRGNSIANLNLGYVYSYDRCEGQYWDASRLETGEDSAQPYPREARAFECLSLAAQADIVEACYKLGDMYKHGTGCEADAREAFHWYARAAELAASEQPVILGSVALRLAGCYEEGLGCTQDFSRALEWYEKAVAGLQIAVDAGDTWYEKALVGAQAGEKRCRQELG